MNALTSRLFSRNPTQQFYATTPHFTIRTFKRTSTTKWNWSFAFARRAKILRKNLLISITTPSASVLTLQHGICNKRQKKKDCRGISQRDSMVPHRSLINFFLCQLSATSRTSISVCKLMARQNNRAIRLLCFSVSIT